ncbi:MAG TPA: hypothetical protein VFW11_24065 [Cyclobacteriaceae bacterium]|nr:hypothetical protein [Cyclobacteriaceae bacterium]
MSADLKFDLLENGLDFIISSVQSITKREGIRDYKYSIIHLSAGLELILKERLKREHWSFIFDNIDKAKKELLATGDFQSVKLDSLLNRLQEHCDIDLAPGDLRVIQDLKKRRNKIEHFAFTDTELSLKSISAKVLNFVFEFIHNELDIDSFSESIKSQVEEIRKNSLEFKEFVIHRYDSMKSKLDELRKQDFTLVVPCPYCDQESLVLDQDKIAHDGLVKCAICLVETDPETAAFDYVENILGYSHYLSIKDRDEFPLGNCPECGLNSLVETNEGYICFNCCGTSAINSITECSYCGEKYYPKADDLGICKNCWEYKESQWQKW